MKVTIFDLLLGIVFVAMFCSAIAAPCVLTAAICSNVLAVMFLISVGAIKNKWVAIHFGGLMLFLLRDLFGHNNSLFYLRFFADNVRSWLSRLEDEQLVSSPASSFSFHPMSNEMLHFRVEAFQLLFSYVVAVVIINFSRCFQVKDKHEP